MGFINLITNREFWKIILYGIIAYFLIFVLIVLGLNIYTQHGRSFPVPDFKGLNEERVAELTKSQHLKFQIIDSIFIPYLEKGSVVDQYPQPGVHVKKNRTIFLTINAFNQAKVEMPNVVGVSFRQGKTTIESRGLKVGKLIYEPDFAKNNVLRQLHMGTVIMPGTMIEKGEYIDLVLGNGLGNSTMSVPDLVKLNYNKAVNEITDGYFNIGSISFDSTVLTFKDTMNAVVWKQRPAYSEASRIIMGGKIDLWLTLDMDKLPKPDTTITIINDL